MFVLFLDLVLRHLGISKCTKGVTVAECQGLVAIQTSFLTEEKMVMQAEAGHILLSRREAYRYWIHKLFFLSFVEYTDVLR